MQDQGLLIITGLPYSGKSTLTKKLIKKYGFKKTSVDEFLSKENYVIEKMSRSSMVQTQILRAGQ